MLKKTIEYEDWDGDVVSEDFYFHISKAELIELEMSHVGGLQESLRRLVNAKDGDAIIKEFKNIILTAYGKRSDDGRRFIKNDAVREEFLATPAYSALFMELVTNVDAMIEFIQAIIPSDLSKEAAKMAGIDPQKTPIIAVVTEEAEVVSKQQIAEMSPEDLENLGKRLASGEVKLGE